MPLVAERLPGASRKGLANLARRMQTISIRPQKPTMNATRQFRQSDAVRGSLPGPIPGVDANLLVPTAHGRDRALADIREACFETGFFCLDELLPRSTAYPAVLRHMQHFFSLPDDDPRKRAIDVTGQDNTHGWMPLYQEPAYQPGTLAHVESFDCGPSTRAPDRANRWPDIEDFRTDVRAFWDELSEAGWSVLRALADVLTLERDFFVDRCNSQELSTMRLLHYPATDAADIDESNVGIAAHTDFECITFIVQTAPGIELRDVRGDWYDAEGCGDRVIVLLGDMLERWTNGRLKATGHRVRNRPFERYSTVLFFAVNDDVVVSPLDSFVSDSNPSRYEPIRQRTHTGAELERAELNRDEFARRPDR